jgi:hypothetical protein
MLTTLHWPSRALPGSMALLLGTVLAAPKAQAQAPAPAPAPVSASAPGGGDHSYKYSPKFGVQYSLISRGNGTYGVRLATSPSPNSPFGQIQFEPGDEIHFINNQPIYGPYSLEQPFGYTNFTFINVRTGQYQQAAAYVQ